MIITLMKNEETTKFSETQIYERLTNPEITKEKQKNAKPKEEPTQKKKEPSASSEVFSFLKDLIICMVSVFIITNFIVRPVQVKGNSMYPTLHDESIGFSDTLGYHIGEIERFDIVIVYIEEKNEYIVKRVIGLPGETVSYLNGNLYINGEYVEEDFLDTSYVESYGEGWMSDVSEITLGDDEYYCLGDNRPHSSDSRYYGPFKKEQIKSKGIFIIWPFTYFGVQTW